MGLLYMIVLCINRKTDCLYQKPFLSHLEKVIFDKIVIT